LAEKSKNQLLQWVLIATLSTTSVLVVGGALYLQHQEKIKQEKEEEAQKRAIFDYETRTRANLVRVYQNLRLDHFLAAYKNIEDLQTPDLRFVEVYREYHEVLQRVARGLLANDFLNEAEILLNRLRNAPEFEDGAREMLIEVASRRRWKSARANMQNAKKFLEEGRYQDAVAEFSKTKAEYQAVKLFKIHDVDAEIAELASYMRQARFFISLNESRVALSEAQKSMAGGFLKEAADRIRRSGDLVARAAFYGGLRPEVQELRRKLLEMEVELSYRFPNALPIQNRFQPAQLESLESFFFLEDAQFDVQKFPGPIFLSLKYRYRSSAPKTFVIRYKVHLADGRFFFDGKLIETALSGGQEQRLEEVIQLEVPEIFRSQRVKKIELEVHDSKEVRYSFVKRAFRLAQAS
jgi:hypothetical protein